MSSSAPWIDLLGTWARPPDLPAKIALGLALAFVLAALARDAEELLSGSRAADPDERRGERRRFVALAAFVAALLSVAYVASYLRGGPRIVDATTYFLQGRTLAHGDLAWTPLEPSASFRGRFLVFRQDASGAALGGLFPPGYPALLAFGFWLGVPMIVGPLLAAALVVTTYLLARTIAEEVVPDLAEPVARCAALLSVVCAALRYHTADTMSHGASALGVAIALTAALRMRRDASRLRLGWAALAGLATGYVAATRPVSAMAIGLVAGALVATRARRSWTVFAAGLVPGLALLLLSQRAVTGAWLTSTQRMYYTVSDGPPGCFRWGFGKGTGCLFEHGEFVAARLEGGFGWFEAAGTTLRRLHMHVPDVANFEPLALLVLVPALAAKKAIAVRAATALVGLQVLAYVPFYFDGDYPGGGARFFADVLPVEHALMVVGVAILTSLRARGRSDGPDASTRAHRRFARGAFAMLAVALVGFAVHASYAHGQLRDRDGGIPMFEPDVLARAGIERGLVFVETDHGFSLGHDPAARPDQGVLVARRRNDARDRLLYEALGKPTTYAYELVATDAPGGADQRARVVPWVPPDTGPTLRFEAEAEWPALSQEGGFAAPAAAGECASGGRALVLTPSSDSAAARVTIPLFVPDDAGHDGARARRRWAVTIHTAAASSSEAEGAVVVGDARWAWKTEGEPCRALTEQTIELGDGATLTLEATGGPVALDRIELRAVDGGARP